ncbi:hypothetical protein [Patulibacter medicamentivorans]|nr:hypothetical protein [Patulibacter medicamentivorans]
MSRRRPLVLLTIALVLAAGGTTALLLRDDDDGGSARTTATAQGARTLAELRPERIIARVEQIRGLRLKRRPRFRVVDSGQVARLIRRQERQDGGAGSSREDRVNVAMLKLIGLLRPDADLRRIQTTLAEDGFLGFYDGDRNEMVIIKRGPRLPVSAESTIAHELVHAIDDQHFGIFRRAQRLARRGDEDAQLAYTSVVEGNAEAVATAYVSRYHVPSEDPGDAQQAKRLERQLPFGLLLSLGFPYAFGESFVGALGAPGDSPRLARALTDRRPRSSSEILDPLRYAARAGTASVRVDAERLLGPRWVPLQPADVLSAVDLLSLLATRERDAAAAVPLAMAWRGGRYAYLRERSADGRGCAAPCTSRDAFVGAVRLNSAANARKAASIFGQTVERRRGRRVGPDAWQVAGGAVAVRTSGAQTTFAYAPTAGLAVRLAERAARSRPAPPLRPYPTADSGTPAR